MSRKLIPLFCAGALALGASPASAQEDGVFVDPGAPTSKEYAIPLENARREAAGGEKKLGPQAQGERSAPLFGEGVGSSGGDSSDSSDDSSGAAAGRARGGGGGGGGSSSKSSSSKSTPASEPTASPSTRRAVVARADAPDGGIGAGITIGALALSVLLLGGVLGSIVRRRGGGAPA